MVILSMTIVHPPLLNPSNTFNVIACTGAYKHTCYHSLLSELNWESLSECRHQYKLITYYKIIYNIYPCYLSNLIPPPPPATYNLRHQPPLRPPNTRLTSTYNSFFPSTTRAWNSLPAQTRQAQTPTLFKKLVRGTNNYNPYHKITTNKYGVWLSRLRMGLSALNAHRYNYNFINSPTCPSCNEENETTLHYFLTCPTYQGARHSLLNTLQTSLGIDTTNNHTLINTILEGHNIHPRHHADLLAIISDYLADTGRFR